MILLGSTYALRTKSLVVSTAKGLWLFDIGKGRGLFDLTHGPFVLLWL